MRRLSTAFAILVLASAVATTANATTSQVGNRDYLTLNNSVAEITIDFTAHFQQPSRTSSPIMLAGLKKKKFSAPASGTDVFASSNDTTNNIANISRDAAARMRRGMRRQNRRGDDGDGGGGPSGSAKKKRGNKKKGSPRRGDDP